jgi:RNA polymerase primary sigma factor
MVDVARERRDLAQRFMIAKRRTEYESAVLRLRFGLNGQEPMVLHEVARALGWRVSRDRVRQVEARGLRKLRHPARARALVPYMEP